VLGLNVVPKNLRRTRRFAGDFGKRRQVDDLRYSPVTSSLIQENVKGPPAECRRAFFVVAVAAQVTSA